MRGDRIASASELLTDRAFEDEKSRRARMAKIRRRLPKPRDGQYTHWHFHPHVVGVLITGWVTVPPAPKAP